MNPQTWKKTPSKVAHNWPPIFFTCSVTATQTAQKQKFRTPKSPLIQDWVFRLGFWWCCSKLLCSSALSVYCSWWPLTAYNGHSERIFGAISYQDFSTRFGNVSLYYVINILMLCTKCRVIFFSTKIFRYIRIFFC